MSDGEICDNCHPLFTAMHDELVGLRETTRRQAGVIGKLRREDDDPREHPDWDRGARLFKAWQRATGHGRSRWTMERFKRARPLLAEYEDEIILRAIEGIAYDPFVSKRANGTTQRHDGWDLLFKSSDKLEEYANKAPLNWRDNLLDHAIEVEGRA